ncbi:hypothetical protein CFE70_006352 [Pyrenophora teres f. teres 0-1]|uniref:F-box domain-containing protein n=2 Tax=Pyrenophora teres f. teres TaxID=97479 RepID=E3RRA2_PYRTT|nr:hypothetical protein PTT_11322 [Pyrenophora teres f. teres 0-1]KAE8827971.1 hypothetical protein HRS9139_07190 [Pyrenophora teres f. teres]KAE8829605.1 hypothetical protein HRS9122_09420 [Pyrenophora teres f. teres]KAE8830569.1 hypothetical protein PTNB85_07156 [Pyrenophora teres f. teres]KAE8857430.1 hypothetical protein PTNB29_08497 [Pyrenophora teres f. teres]
MTSFLQLPSEIRLQVYSHMAIPFTTPFSAYRGLYLSCRQIRAEMDDECGKILGEYLHTIKAGLEDDVSTAMTIPGDFLSMQHVRLDFSHRTTRLHLPVHRSHFDLFWPTHFASMIVWLPPKGLGAVELTNTISHELAQLGRDAEVGIAYVLIHLRVGRVMTIIPANHV